MELTNHHRAALLDELFETEAERQHATVCRSSEGAKEDLAIQESFEIKEFLAIQRIETIKKALIDNDIDY